MRRATTTWRRSWERWWLELKHEPVIRSSSTLRSIGAIVAGLVAIFVLSLGTDAVLHALGVYTPWDRPISDKLALLATAYRIVYAVAGSYITARLAPGKPMQHALVLGVIGIVLSALGAADLEP